MRQLFCTFLWWLARKSAKLAHWLEKPKDICCKAEVGAYQLNTPRDEEWTPGNETYVPICSEPGSRGVQVGYSVRDARSRRLKRVVMFDGPLGVLNVGAR